MKAPLLTFLPGMVCSAEHARVTESLHPGDSIQSVGLKMASNATNFNEESSVITRKEGCNGPITQRLYNLYDNIFYMHTSVGTYDADSGYKSCVKAIPDSGSFRSVFLTDMCVQKNGHRSPNCDTEVKSCLHLKSSTSFKPVSDKLDSISYGQGTVLAVRGHESISVGQSLTCPDGLRHPNMPMLGVVEFTFGFNTLVQNNLCAIIGLGKTPDQTDDLIPSKNKKEATNTTLEEEEEASPNSEAAPEATKISAVATKHKEAALPASTKYASLMNRLGVNTFAFCFAAQRGGAGWVRWGHEVASDHATVSIVGKNHWAMLIKSVELVFTPEQAKVFKNSKSSSKMSKSNKVSIDAEGNIEEDDEDTKISTHKRSV